MVQNTAARPVNKATRDGSGTTHDTREIRQKPEYVRVGNFGTECRLPVIFVIGLQAGSDISSYQQSS